MDQLEKNQRYTLVKLNSKFNSLEKVKNELLGKDKQVIVPFHEEREEYSKENSEDNFYYNWKDIGDFTDLNSSKDIKYLVATAKCEFSKRKIKEGTEYLPKNQRLNIQETEVIFVESNNKVFAIIKTFDPYELKRVRKLINIDNIEPLSSEYQIVPALFTWLFYKFTNSENIDDDIEITGINGFTGNVLTDENKFTGDSESTPDLIITKAFLANNYDITSIKMDMVVNEVPTSFLISQTNPNNELRVMAIRGSMSDIIMDSGDNVVLVAIYIFFKLIPRIFSAYTKAKVNFGSNQKPIFLKKLAIDVIKQIVARNSLTKSDIFPD